MSTHFVAVKLTDTELRAIDQLIAFEKARTRSGALREGLMLLLDFHKVKFETKLAIRQERIRHRMRKGRKEKSRGE